MEPQTTVLYCVKSGGRKGLREEKWQLGARRIKSEKLREHQNREGYARSLEGKKLDRDGDNNVEHMWGEWYHYCYS